MEKRIYILDGAMGTMIQRYALGKDGAFQGNNEYLNLSEPEAIKAIHKEYIAAGADIIETNTFSANRISQAEYGCADKAAEMAFAGARIAREAADEAMMESGRKVYVAGSMGPTSKSLSLSPDAADPSFRTHSFEEMKSAYKEQAKALTDAGADLILLETCFDALNVKAALAAVSELRPNNDIPLIISVSVGDKSGRTLTGQTLEAFYISVCHYPLSAFGINCSLGASEMMPLVEEISGICDCPVICYPNAGLPDESGEYTQGPEEMASQVRMIAEKGLVNIVGGCCGTTPEHIRAVAEALKDVPARDCTGRQKERTLRVSGLEAVTVDVKRKNFTNIGERTNVAGSRKFARLIADGQYDEAMRIAAKQIEDGAAIIDINMDDALLDGRREMERFVRYISNDPDVARAALMIDSSDWETIVAGLQNAQGKCIVNSISLKEGEEEFIRKARIIRMYGAAVVVMAFDEEGQAVTFARKRDICRRAYGILTGSVGFPPEDIIFDANILSIGTGMEEHADYGKDFIEAVRWIRANLPGAQTSGGLSNLSFAFRGNNVVREAMHSAFLYHAIEAGLDMAILNPSMLQVYDEIEPELLKCVEDVIFNTDSGATERLIEKAERCRRESDGGNPMQSGTEYHIGDSHKNTDVSSPDFLKKSMIKGRDTGLEQGIKRALDEYGSAVGVIEGPLMEGMEEVGRMFAEGKMFLPQVIKSAKVMREAVEILKPYMDNGLTSDRGKSAQRNVIVIATVKGDVHDIGKNITGIVLTCNGFEVHDIGVMVDGETILNEAERLGADIIAVSGLITPSLYQMEEICRKMSERKMTKALFVGGATTSARHTALKLAPLYDHVYHGADASEAAVMAKKYIADRESFEREQHAIQEEIRRETARKTVTTAAPAARLIDGFHDSYPPDVPLIELSASEVMPFFDWRMFYAIWGVKYGSAVPEAMEIVQLRRDAEDEIAIEDFRIMLSARFFDAYRNEDDAIVFTDNGTDIRWPMLRQEQGEGLSLCDFVIDEETGRKSPFGIFGICVHKRSKAHIHGCSCPACSNVYEDMIGRTVRMTLAEAASAWLSKEIETAIPQGMRFIRPAAGYAACPDHTLKGDILSLIDSGLGISCTESFAMQPESSICGMIFIHSQAKYPEIRKIGQEQYERYARMRGFSQEDALRFLNHLKR